MKYCKCMLHVKAKDWILTKELIRFNNLLIWPKIEKRIDTT